MNPVEIALFIITGIVGFSLFLQLKDRSKATPPPSVPEPTPEPEYTLSELQAMTRADLIKVAQKYGYTDIPKSWTKGRILSKLVEILEL